MPLIALGDAAGRERWLVEAHGRSYLVIVRDGGPVVTDALCPHKQLPLVDGIVRDGALVCPGHWYAYDLTDGGCRTTGEVTMPIYDVVSQDGALYADVPDAVAPLSWSERLRAHAAGER